jgi:hypothetical protein
MSKVGYLLGRLVRRLLLLWGYGLGRLRSNLPTRRSWETLWGSRLLLLLLLALQFLQELLRSLDQRLTVRLLLLLLVRLSGLVGWLILEPSGVVSEVVVHLLGLLPGRNHTRRQGLRLSCHRLIPRIRLHRSFRRAT